jgi:hypothetical protein
MPRRPARLVLVACGVALAGCGSGSLEVTAEPAVCAAMDAGAARDVCWKGVIDAAPAEAWSAVVEHGGKIEDPVVRGAAIFGWVRSRTGLPAEAAAVCQLLEGAERAACERRVQSAHLQR